MEKTDGERTNIREPAVAGAFYPSDPALLRVQIKDFLSNVKKERFDGRIVALISPHAGYMYSGQVAAFGYKLLEGSDFSRVIVIAPSHRAYFKGASVYNKRGYRTPLGVVPIDEDLSNEIIAKDSMIGYHPQAHISEHSLEVQVPFLQVVLKEFKLVPIVMGSQDFNTSNLLSEALVKTIKDEKVLIIASTDLSHFHHYDKAVHLDNIVLKHIEAFDPEGLSQALDKGRCEACGGGPVITAMLIARKLGANKTRVLRYANSGDMTGDKSRVVGYASALLYKNIDKLKDLRENKRVGVDLGLNKEEKNTLLEIARTTIESKARDQDLPEFDISSDVLKEERGAFVSLHKHSRLRGCIGNIRGRRPLHITIQEMASAAAFNDPRFEPVTKDELNDLHIEISVLTPLLKVDDLKEIEVGKHGIYIEKGYHSGLLLPQVATEYGWDRITFLEQTCNKAGLTKDAWKDKDTRIYIFSADIFSKDKL
ncbi:MAG: AmmeMemoRadiSam system protein B [Thermodesulfobacteriota bacterium]|nr:AmmeMemoRadiSam system protein B [Thermodesulfobacteriota bacterium]